MQHNDLVRERVVGGLPSTAGGLALAPGAGGGAGNLQHPAQQDDRVRRLLRMDQPVQLVHRSFSFARKAVAFSGSRSSAAVRGPPCAAARAPRARRRSVHRTRPRPGRSALARRYQPRRDSELTPSSRATTVTVSPEESTSAIASRLNSSVYRFGYVLPTCCCFLRNLKIPASRGPRSRGSFTWGHPPTRPRTITRPTGHPAHSAPRRPHAPHDPTNEEADRLVTPPHRLRIKLNAAEKVTARPSSPVSRSGPQQLRGPSVVGAKVGEPDVLALFVALPEFDAVRAQGVQGPLLGDEVRLTLQAGE